MPVKSTRQGDRTSRVSGHALMVLSLAALLATAISGGCATYTTPGGPADFRALGLTQAQADAMTTDGVREALNRKPAAGFPAAIAVTRLQGQGYRSYTRQGYGTGAFTVVTVRDVEKDTDFERLAKLPMVAGIAPLNRLVVPGDIRKEEDLRAAAAQVQADILLIYTFDTQFETDTVVPFAGVLTLGMFPSERAKVATTVSSAFIDVRTGYIYGLSEVTVSSSRIANGWTSREAVDQTRQEVEADGFAKIVSEWEKNWTSIAARYGPASVGTANATTTAPSSSSAEASAATPESK